MHIKIIFNRKKGRHYCLELGPGSDLGTGLCLLWQGCAKYNALDVNRLMRDTHGLFYRKLIDKIGSLDKNADLGFLEGQLSKAKNNGPSKKNKKLNYGVTYQTARTDLLGLKDMGLLETLKEGKKFIFTPVPDIAKKLES